MKDNVNNSLESVQQEKIDLAKVREEIDAIDPKLRELLMRRLDCSYKVAEVKAAAGDTYIYKQDREDEILSRLSDGVPAERVAGYLSVVRKIMETSRMYQYGLLFDWDEHVFDDLAEGIEIPECGKYIKVAVTRPNKPNAMSSILSMIGDYGCNMERMELKREDEETVAFELTLLADLSQSNSKKLMFQLSRECQEFKILEVGL